MAWTNWLMELGDGGFGSAVSRCPDRRARGGRRGNAKMERRLGGQAQGLQDAAVRARASTARGLRAQASGDGWRHAANNL